MKKKSIGTLSLNINTSDFNYGAILHSWAFQQFLDKYGKYNVEIIDYITPHLEKCNLKYPIYSSIKNKKLRTIIKSIIFYITYKLRY